MNSKWALITGASAGFGSAIAEIFAENKWNVVITGRREDRLLELETRLRKDFGVDVKRLAFDIQDHAAVTAAVKSLPSEVVSKIEVLVNNAGLAQGTDPFPEANVKDWDTMIDTNVKGLLYVTREVLPSMLKLGGSRGHVVNIGSVAGRWNYPGGAVYSATKFAVRAINDSLRMDLMGSGVRVTNIEPGMAETEFSLVRFNGDKGKAEAVYKGMTALKPRDIAESVWWCVNRPQHVNIQEMVIFPTDQAGVGPQYVHRK